MERIGDVADKIARMLTDNANKPQPPLVSLENMGRRTIKMLHDVLDAFARMDLDAAPRSTRKMTRWTGVRVHHPRADDLHDGRSPHHPQVLNVLWAASGHRAGRRSLPAHLRVHRLLRQGQDVRHTKADDLSDLLGKADGAP